MDRVDPTDVRLCLEANRNCGLSVDGVFASVDRRSGHRSVVAAARRRVAAFSSLAASFAPTHRPTPFCIAL